MKKYLEGWSSLLSCRGKIKAKQLTVTVKWTKCIKGVPKNGIKWATTETHTTEKQQVGPTTQVKLATSTIDSYSIIKGEENE